MVSIENFTTRTTSEAKVRLEKSILIISNHPELGTENLFVFFWLKKTESCRIFPTHITSKLQNTEQTRPHCCWAQCFDNSNLPWENESRSYRQFHTWKQKLTVAARLRSLRSDDPLSKRHPRSIKQGLELYRHSNLLMNYDLIHSNIYRICVLINLYLGYVVDTYPLSIHM